MKSLIFLILLMAVTGCGGTKIHYYKAHDFSRFDPAEMAVLHVSERIFIKEIDGKGQYYPSYISDVSPYSGARIELLPGKHVASVSYKLKGAYSSKKWLDVKFEVRPGKEYFITEKLEFVSGRSYATFHVYECGGEKERALNAARKKSAEQSMFLSYRPVCGQ